MNAERFVGHGLGITELAGVLGQGLASQEREVVRHLGMGPRRFLACLAQHLHGHRRGHAGIFPGQKVVHGRLGARDHRLDVPEGVVQIEADRADVGQLAGHRRILQLVSHRASARES